MYKQKTFGCEKLIFGPAGEAKIRIARCDWRKHVANSAVSAVLKYLSICHILLTIATKSRLRTFHLVKKYRFQLIYHAMYDYFYGT